MSTPEVWGHVSVRGPCTTLWGNGNIQIWLLLRIMSGSAWLCSMLKSEVLVGTKGHTEAWCLVVSFFGVREPCSCQSHPTSWSQNFCLGQVAAKGYVRVCGCSWGLSWCLGPVSLQGTMCDEIRAPCWASPSDIFSEIYFHKKTFFQ